MGKRGRAEDKGNGEDEDVKGMFEVLPNPHQRGLLD
jgi:hypothetical protein